MDFFFDLVEEYQMVFAYTSIVAVMAYTILVLRKVRRIGGAKVFEEEPEGQNGLTDEERTEAKRKAFEKFQMAEKETNLKRAFKFAMEAIELEPDNALYLDRAGYYALQGRSYDQAIELYEKAYQLMEGTVPDDHPELANTLNNLGNAYLNMGKHALAEPVLKRAIEIWEKSYGENHIASAPGLTNLAGLYQVMKNYEEAENLYKRALHIRQEEYGPDHSEVALALNNLGGLYFTLKEYKKAEPLTRRSVGILEKVYGPDHPQFASGLDNYSTLLRMMGRDDEAIQVEKRVKDIRTGKTKKKQPFG